MRTQALVLPSFPSPIRCPLQSVYLWIRNLAFPLAAKLNSTAERCLCLSLSLSLSLSLGLGLSLGQSLCSSYLWQAKKRPSISSSDIYRPYHDNSRSLIRCRDPVFTYSLTEFGKPVPNKQGSINHRSSLFEIFA